MFRFPIGLLGIVLVVGCSTSETPEIEPVDERSSAIAPIESQPPVDEPDGPEWFLAVVSQTGIEHCPNHSDFAWLDVQPTLGWTTTSGPEIAQLDALMDLPVLARGSAGPAPERPPLQEQPKPCPPMQMRSDWVNTPRGVRVQRTTPTAAGHFHLTSVRRLDELKVEESGELLVASFENPLPFPLAGVRLRMHYEGCYGKPGATSLESDIHSLAPGETIRFEFPRIVERDGPRGPHARKHLAASLTLDVAAEQPDATAKVWTDLDVSLHELGLALRCQ